MIILGDTLLRSIMREGLRDIRNDAALLGQITLTMDERNQLAGWILQQGDTLDQQVILGFPGKGVTFPCISIIMTGEQEEQNYLGDLIESEEDEHVKGLYRGVRGALFRSTWRVAVVSENADLCVWLAAVIKWQLFRKRDELEAGGLLEQKLSLADFEPAPEWLPLLLFSRGVMLQAAHYDTYPVQDNFATKLALTMNNLIPDGLGGGTIEDPSGCVGCGYPVIT